MLPIQLDHCVIHVTDWERSNAFYTAVLGAELVTRPAGYAYRLSLIHILKTHASRVGIIWP